MANHFSRLELQALEMAISVTLKQERPHDYIKYFLGTNMPMADAELLHAKIRRLVEAA